MLMKKIMALRQSGHPARGRDRRRRQRHAGRGRLRRPARRLHTTSTSTRRCAWPQNWDDPNLLHLGPLPKFANGAGSTVFWTTGSRAVQVRPEQGEGRRVHQGPHLRPADLEGLDRRHAERPSRPAAALQVDLCRVGRQPAGLDAALRRAGPRPARQGQGDREQHLRPPAVRRSASRSGRPTSRARSPIPKVAMQKVMDAVKAEMESRQVSRNALPGPGRDAPGPAFGPPLAKRQPGGTSGGAFARSGGTGRYSAD